MYFIIYVHTYVHIYSYKCIFHLCLPAMCCVYDSHVPIRTCRMLLEKVFEKCDLDKVSTASGRCTCVRVCVCRYYTAAWVCLHDTHVHAYVFCWCMLVHVKCMLLMRMCACVSVCRLACWIAFVCSTYWRASMTSLRRMSRTR